MTDPVMTNETLATKQHRLERLEKQRAELIREARILIGRPANEQVIEAWKAYAESRGDILFPVREPNGVARWFAIPKDIYEYAQKFADEIHLLKNEMTAPHLYGQLIESMANSGRTAA